MKGPMVVHIIGAVFGKGLSVRLHTLLENVNQTKKGEDNEIH